MLVSNPSELSSVCFKIFSNVREICLFFVLPIFLLRVTYLNLVGSESNSFIAALKGLVLFFVLCFTFDYVLELLFEIPQAFMPDFSYERIIGQKVPERPGFEVESGYFDQVPTFLRWIGEVVIAFLFHAATSIHMLFMMVMSGLAPLVFLLATQLGIGIGVKLFFGLMILSSSWPIIWYGFDELSTWYAQYSTGGFDEIVFEILVYLLKIIGPFGLAIGAMESGPGSSVVSATRMATKTRR